MANGYEYWFTGSVIFVYIPAGFFLVASIIGLFVETKMKRFLQFYALMLGGMLAGFFAGGVTGFLLEETAGLCVGGLTGGVVGFLTGLFACSLLSDDNHMVNGSIFLFGGIAAGLIGMLAGGLAGVQNYLPIGKYLLLLLAIEFVSFVIAQIVKFVRNVVWWRFKTVAGW